MGDNLWLVGAGLSIIGSIFSNLGVNVQKYSQNKEAERPKDQQRVYYKQGFWVMGIILVVLGSLGDFWALSMAAQSIVAPIGSITLVTNVLFARFGLHEELTRMDVIGTALVIVGSVLSVAFGNHESKEYTLDQLKELYQATGFIVYIVLMVIALVVMYIAAKKLEPMKTELVEYAKRFERTLSKDFCDEDEEDSDEEHQLMKRESDDELDKERLLLLDSKDKIRELSERYKPFEKIHPFLLCALSGVFGAQSVLFAKTNAEMMDVSFRGNNQYDQFLPYLFLPTMLFFIFSQLHWMAVALKNFDALYVVPVFQCFFIIVSTLGGAVFFQEFASFSVLQGIMFPIGVVITLIGVWILSQRDMAEAADEWNLVENQPAEQETFVKQLDFDQDASLRSVSTMSVSRSASRSRSLSVFLPTALKMSEAKLQAKGHTLAAAPMTPVKSDGMMAGLDSPRDQNLKSPSYDSGTRSVRQQGSAAKKDRPVLKKAMTTKSRGEQNIAGNSPATRHARRISKFGVDDVKRELQESYKSIRRVSRISRGSISVPFATFIGSMSDITSKQAGHEPKKGRVSRRRASTMVRLGSQRSLIPGVGQVPARGRSNTSSIDSQASSHQSLSFDSIQESTAETERVVSPASNVSLTLDPVSETDATTDDTTTQQETPQAEPTAQEDVVITIEDTPQNQPESDASPPQDEKSKRMVQQRPLDEQDSSDPDFERNVPEEFPTSTIKALYEDEVLGDRVARMRNKFGGDQEEESIPPTRDDSQAQLLGDDQQ